MISIERAYQLRALVEQASAALDDKTASTGAELFPRLKGDGTLISTGTRINWKGTIKKAANDLWDTEENNPDNAPALWEDILYRDGIRIIPETITVTTAFSEGELGWWCDVLYRSIYQGANVWTPDAYPAAWTKVE